MTPSHEAIVRNPEWLPHTYDETGANLIFLPVSRMMHSELPFLSGGELIDRAAPVPLSEVEKALPHLAAGPLHFIFHTAFCCSTLLVDALATATNAVGMKEPAVFQNLLHRIYRAGVDGERERMHIVMRLLERPFANSTATLVKPSCFTNSLIPLVLEQCPTARAVLLTAPLRSFLFSVARRGIRGRSWGRQAYLSAVRHTPLDLGFRDADTIEQTDLQVAGLAWLMRRHFFDRIAGEIAAERILRLDSDAIVADPAIALASVADHFSLATEADAIGEVVGGPLFRTHRKERRPFGPEERRIERQSSQAHNGEEVEIAAEWIEAVARQHGLSAG